MPRTMTAVPIPLTHSEREAVADVHALYGDDVAERDYLHEIVRMRRRDGAYDGWRETIRADLSAAGLM